MTPAAPARRVPPGPDIHLTVQSVQRDPLGFLMDLTRRYGDVVRYQADDWTVIFVNRPAYVRHVLQDNHPNYAKKGTPDLLMLKPMLGEGLLTSDGPTWVRQRRMTQPFFHRERIEAFGELMTACTRHMLTGWRVAAYAGKGIEVTEEMTRLTTRIVSRALFGVDLQDSVGQFGTAVQAMNEYMGNFDARDRARFGRFVAAHRVLEGVVDRIVERRRREGGTSDDFLGMLLAARDEESGEGLSDRQVRDQVMTLLMAGHETTAKTLTWAFYLLDRHEEALARLQRELRDVLGGRPPAVRDLPALPWTAMVLHETMRLYPAVWVISRKALADDEIGGYHVPAGCLVLVSPYALHRHPAFWDEPEAFRPERFASEAPGGREPFSHFPFSGGPRQCIGKSFATVEMQLVLATIAQAYRLRVAPDHPVEPEALVTLRPRHGLPVTLEATEAARYG